MCDVSGAAPWVQSVVRSGVTCTALRSRDAHKQQQSSHTVPIEVGLCFYLLAGLSWILSEAYLEPSI